MEYTVSRFLLCPYCIYCSFFLSESWTGIQSSCMNDTLVFCNLRELALCVHLHYMSCHPEHIRKLLSILVDNMTLFLIMIPHQASATLRIFFVYLVSSLVCERCGTLNQCIFIYFTI